MRNALGSVRRLWFRLRHGPATERLVEAVFRLAYEEALAKMCNDEILGLVPFTDESVQAVIDATVGATEELFPAKLAGSVHVSGRVNP